MHNYLGYKSVIYSKTQNVLKVHYKYIPSSNCLKRM